jgi:hypothetical protein
MTNAFERFANTLLNEHLKPEAKSPKHGQAPKQ